MEKVSGYEDHAKIRLHSQASGHDKTSVMLNNAIRAAQLAGPWHLFCLSADDADSLLLLVRRFVW